MTTSSLTQPLRRSRVARRPHRYSTPQSLVHLVLGGAIGFLTMLAIIAVVCVVAAVVATVVLPVLATMVLFAFVRASTALTRSRYAAVLHVDIAPPPRPRADGLWRQFAADFREPTTWRQLAYHLFAGIISTTFAWVVVAMFAAGVVLTTTMVWTLSVTIPDPAYWQTFNPFWSPLLTLVGLALLALLPTVARGLTTLDVLLARPLLGPTQSEMLSDRVVTLSLSRAGVVDAADAERRRIERDLHDGTQQRLTSLAMNLGLARATLTDLPASAQAALTEAHDEAKLALGELRSFVRGLHPAVLDDRGLDAALSGVVARSPIPATLEVDLPVRPSPTIEAVAYFVVSEALTNAAKHSGASAVDIVLTSDGAWLHLRVSDNGRGGADPALGSGLAGLRQRIEAVDGHLVVDSPAGGPTTLVAELPSETGGRA